MKKLKFLFSMLLCMGQVFLFAQEEASRFRLELSNQSIFTQGNELVIGPNMNFHIGEKVYNYASHLSGFWRLGNRLELGVGLGYANRDAYVGRSFCSYIPCRRPGDFFPDRYTRIRSLEIPVELRWKYWKSAKRIIPYFSVGIANRIPIIDSSVLGNGKTRLSLDDYAMGVTLGAGTQIKIFEKWSLLFEVKIRKDSNFNFEKHSRTEGIRWFNEGVIKLGLGRNF